MVSIEKVYDELYGMIEDLKKQIAAGGGGSDVTITPALESGTKIADFEIDDTPGVLYAPAQHVTVAPFIDAAGTAIVPETTFTSSAEYTATVDCVVFFRAVVTDAKYAAANIGGLTVWSRGVSMLGAAITFVDHIFLKAGQTITIVNSDDQQSNWYKVYGLLDATQPVSEAKKTTKKK